MFGPRTKSVIIFSLITLYLFLISYFWNSIKLPFSNEENVVGYLMLNNINPANDTFRFLLFLVPPLILIFIHQKLNYPKKSEQLKYFFKNETLAKKDFKLSEVLPVLLLLFVYIAVEFLSIDLTSQIYLDTLHDGDYLTPLINYVSFNGLWTSSFTIHGGRDLFIPILAFKLFDTVNIAPVKYLFLLSIFIIKFLSIILSFQISKLTNLDKRYKIIIFTLLSFFSLSISDYYNHAYGEIRDIFVLLFFILFFQIFLKKNSLLLSYLLSATTAISLFFHYDTGVYLNLIFCFFTLFLFISARTKEMMSIIFFLVLNYLFIYLYLGNEETLSFVKQLLHIIQNIDKIHGLEYPRPFFSIGIEEHGSRATRILVLILLTGIIVNFFVFRKNNYLATKEKVLILFFYLYALISFKNALGRSDGAHMMISSDWTAILLFSFILFTFFFLTSKKIKFSYLLNSLKFIMPIFIIIIIFLTIDKKNIINYTYNFNTFIQTSNNKFLTNDRKEILKKISKLINKEECIENFTADLSLPYLLKKPNCTQFFTSWIASGKKIETEYIKILEQKKIKFIIYESPLFQVDGIKTNQRLKLVNAYIKKNYLEVFNDNEYIIMKKKIYLSNKIFSKLY